MRRALSAIVFLAGCGTARQASVSDHRAAAERERAAAEEPRVALVGGSPFLELLATDADTARHLQHAAEHERAATELERFEADECRPLPNLDRAACPLLAGVASIEELADGVRLRFARGVDVAALAARMRCHLAFARSRGFEPSATCALYLPGVSVRTDGERIDLIGSSHAAVRELRRNLRTRIER